MLTRIAEVKPRVYLNYLKKLAPEATKATQQAGFSFTFETFAYGEQKIDECLSEVANPSDSTTSLFWGGLDYKFREGDFKFNFVSKIVDEIIREKANELVRTHRFKMGAEIVIPISLLLITNDNPSCSLESDSILGGLLAAKKDNPDTIPEYPVLIDYLGSATKATIKLTGLLNIVGVQDKQESGIEDYLDSGADFIHRAIDSGHLTFVFCRKGINRSRAMLLAYLILHKQLSYSEALDYAHKYRPLAKKETFTFVKELTEYDLRVRAQDCRPHSGCILAEVEQNARKPAMIFSMLTSTPLISTDSIEANPMKIASTLTETSGCDEKENADRMARL